jgi:twitching motility protein PilT
LPNLHQLLKATIEQSATELILTTGSPPQLRIAGELIPLKTDVVNPDTAKEMIYSVLTEEQVPFLEKNLELRASFGVRDLSRFRITIFNQRGALGAVIKPVPYKVPPMDPALAAISSWATQTGGLFVISGCADSGRTTALATLVNAVNDARHVHIITVEYPIEYLHPHKNSLVDQIDAQADAIDLRAALDTAAAARGDIIAVDAEPLDLLELLPLVRTGATVFTTLTATNANDATEQLSREPRIQRALAGHAHLTLPRAPKGTPRKLSVQVAHSRA